MGFESGRPIPKDSLLFVCIGSTIGKVAQLKQGAITNQQINSLIVNNKFTSDFLYPLLDKESTRIRLLASNQAVPIINKSLFSKVELYVTLSRDEQLLYGHLFRILDCLLTLYQSKIDMLTNLKKFLLQQMFI